MPQPQRAYIPALVGRLQHGSEAEQAAAATALHIIALADGDSRDAVAAEIAAAGGIPALLQLLSSRGAHPGAADAAGLLCNLTFNSPPRCQAVMAADGTATLAASLESSSNASVQSNAANALANISNYGGEAGNAAIAASGGIPPAVRRLSSSDDSVAEHAALLVRNLSTSAEPSDAIFEAGGIPLLTCLLRRPSQAALLRQSPLRSGAGAIADHAAGALASLTFGEGSGPRITAIAAAGGIAPLVELLATSGNGTRTVESAAVAVANMLARGPASTAPTVIEAGGIVALLRCLQGQQFSSETHTWAALAVKHLACGGEEPSAAVADAGGARALLHALARPCSSETKTFSAFALLGLVRHGQAAAVAAADTSNAAAAALESLPSTVDVAEALRLLAAARVCAAPGCGATAGLRQCKGCGSVRYCSEACMRTHWKEHRPECKRLRAAAAAAGRAAGPSTSARP